MGMGRRGDHDSYIASMNMQGGAEQNISVRRHVVVSL
jgi:hypothetical protein